jgi:phosphoribosylaminoimidazole carboxylase (NCAIR synthetase)
MSHVIHRFPTVGIIGAGHMARMAVAPAISLGITLKLFAEDKDDSAAQICDHVI